MADIPEIASQKVWVALDEFRIEVPSWGFANTGTRFGKFIQPAAATTILASFTSFFVPEKIPTGIIVPCSGTGTVVFAPSPVSSTAKSAKLPVTFLNIGT